MAARLWLFAKIAAATAILVLVIRKNDWGQTVHVLQSAHGLLVAAGFVSVGVAVVFSALRWREITTVMTDTLVPAKLALVGTFEGMFFNLFLPTGIGGDAARAYRAFDQSVGWKNAVFSSIIDRALGLATLGFLLALAALSDPASRELAMFPFIVAVGAGLAVGALLVAIIGHSVPVQLGRLARVWDLLSAFSKVAFSSSIRWKLWPLLLLSTVLNCLALWLFAMAAGADVNPSQSIVVLGTASLAALLPITIGGWGVREGTIAMLFTSLGQSPGAGAAVSILYAGGLVAIGLVGGTVWLLSPYRHPAAEWKSMLFPNSARDPSAAKSADADEGS